MWVPPRHSHILASGGAIPGIGSVPSPCLLLQKQLRSPGDRLCTEETELPACRIWGRMPVVFPPPRAGRHTRQTRKKSVVPPRRQQLRCADGFRRAPEKYGCCAQAFWKLSLICKHSCWWETKGFLWQVLAQITPFAAASGVTFIPWQVREPLRCFLSIHMQF